MVVSRMRTPTQFVAPRRVMAVVTVLAFVFAGIMGRAHEATTSHVRCAEHGELVHGATHLEAIELARDTIVDEQAPANAQNHEHCELACASRAASLQARSFVLVRIALATADLVVAAPHAATPHRDGLYRTAPKTSPPV